MQESTPGAGKLSQVAATRFSLQESIGGPRGLVESVLPYTVFSLVYGVGKDLQPAIIAAFAPVVVLTIWRLIAREPLQQVISGALGIALGAYIANKTGRAEDFFLPSIWKNTGFAVVYAVSMVVRWPMIGVVVGPITGEMFEWRKDRARLAVFQWATALWVGMFALRLAIQVPLYLAGQATLLGYLNGLVLGIPLFALTIYFTWLIVRSVPAVAGPQPKSHDENSSGQDEDSDQHEVCDQDDDLTPQPEPVPTDPKA